MPNRPPFSQQVSQALDELRPTATELTRDAEKAEALLRETSERAHALQGQKPQGTEVTEWMRAMMKDIFITTYRRKVKHQTIGQTAPPEVDPAEAPDPELAGADIAGAIETLEKEYRVPFLMHFQGHKFHEIAEHLFLPIGEVKSRINHARKELKKTLKAE